jgi:hypothetical protein
MEDGVFDDASICRYFPIGTVGSPFNLTARLIFLEVVGVEVTKQSDG